MTQPDPPRQITGHQGQVYDIAVTPDGQTMLSVGEDKRRQVWDLSGSKQLRISNPEWIGRSHAIAVSSDGETFFTGGNFLAQRRVADGEFAARKPITHHRYGIRAICALPDGRYLASLSLQHQIHLNSLDPEQPNAVKDIGIPSQHCTRIDFSPDGKYLYFSRQIGLSREKIKEPNRFVVWDIESEQAIFEAPPTLQGTRRFGAVDAAGDGSLVAIAGEGHVQLFDARRLTFAASIAATQSTVLDVAFSPDDSRLAWASKDGTIAVVNLHTKSPSGSLYDTIYQQRLGRVSINTIDWVDNERLISGDADGQILLHEIGGSLPATANYIATQSEIQRNGRDLVVVDRNRMCTVIDIASGRPRVRIDQLPAGAIRYIRMDRSARTWRRCLEISSWSGTVGPEMKS